MNASAGAHVALETRTGFDPSAQGVDEPIEPIHVSTDRDFDDATVHLAYDDAAVGNESDLTLFVYNESRQVFEPQPTTVDADANTVTATTTENGTMMLVPETQWFDRFRSPDEIPKSTVEKSEFDDPGADCSGICVSTGDTVVVGVTSDGPGSLDTSTASQTGSGTADGSATRTGTGTAAMDGNSGGFTFLGTVGPDGTCDSDGDGVINDYDDCPSTYGEGPDGCPVEPPDSDEDGVPNSEDDCPYIAGGGENGCPVDENDDPDGDGVLNDDDACPNTYGTGPDGCPETPDDPDDPDGDGIENDDDHCDNIAGPPSNDGCPVDDSEPPDGDGDGVNDESDLCDATAGNQTNGCPPSTLSLTVMEFPGRVDKLVVEATGVVRVDDADSAVGLELLSEDGRRTLYEQQTPTNGTESFTISRTMWSVPPQASIRMRAEGTAAIGLANLEVRADTDGDGLWDATELGGFDTDRFGRITTDPTSPDTDGDTVPDGVEVGDRVVVQDGIPPRPTTHYQLVGHPDDKNSDSDDLHDGTEYDGWKVDVFTRNGQPHRKYFAEDRTKYDDPGKQTIHFDSDLLDADTDRDGLEDHEERFETYTDPRDAVTYAITEEHEQLAARLSEGDYSAHSVQSARTVGLLPDDQYDLDSLSLDDESDDFDFVTPAPGELFFTALDGEERTDTWLSNRDEIDAGYDVWDPDMDDDGLTDGQEVHGLTIADTLNLQPIVSKECHGRCYEHRRGESPFRTDPTEADDDGDGYWDGWIGVYGVGVTDDVVLYREHLQSGNGIQGDEIVAEQAELHHLWHVDRVPSTVTAATVDYDGDDYVEHSKLHVGELQWGTDPVTPSERVDLSIEMDFIEKLPNDRLNHSGFVTGVETNWALYGIEIGITRDGLTYPDDLVADPPGAPHTRSTEADQYMAAATESPFPGIGFNGYATTGGYAIEGMYIYVQSIVDSPVLGRVESQHIARSPYVNETQVVAGFVAMHEIGHSFNAGVADDAGVLPAGEVYSGSAEDKSPEYTARGGVPDWSIMRSSWDDETVHMNNERLGLV